MGVGCPIMAAGKWGPCDVPIGEQEWGQRVTATAGFSLGYGSREGWNGKCSTMLAVSGALVSWRKGV